MMQPRTRRTLVVPEAQRQHQRAEVPHRRWLRSLVKTGLQALLAPGATTAWQVATGLDEGKAEEMAEKVDRVAADIRVQMVQMHIRLARKVEQGQMLDMLAMEQTEPAEEMAIQVGEERMALMQERENAVLASTSSFVPSTPHSIPMRLWFTRR
jgi:hypothetical protein